MLALWEFFWTQPVSNSVQTPYEDLISTQKGYATPWEALAQATGVAQLFVLSYESLVSMLPSQVSDYESLLQINKSVMVNWEDLATLLGISTINFESDSNIIVVLDIINYESDQRKFVLKVKSITVNNAS